MTKNFILSFKSEWLKKKNSQASWLVLIGSLFVPFIYIISRIVYSETTIKDFTNINFWDIYWVHKTWEIMALFLFPVGIILVVSMLSQIENKNNSWKQLHSLPLKYSTIYFSKLLMIITIMLQFLIIYNIGIYLTILLPYLVIKGATYPTAIFPLKELLLQNLKYFIDCLPIITLQFLFSMRLRNFVVPMGLGFIMWISSFIALRWKHGILLPYSYTMYNYTNPDNNKIIMNLQFSIHTFAILYSLLFIVLGFYMYLKQKDKS
jgi:hypothetical protein